MICKQASIVIHIYRHVNYLPTRKTESPRQMQPDVRIEPHLPFARTLTRRSSSHLFQRMRNDQPSCHGSWTPAHHSSRWCAPHAATPHLTLSTVHLRGQPLDGLVQPVQLLLAVPQPRRGFLHGRLYLLALWGGGGRVRETREPTRALS